MTSKRERERERERIDMSRGVVVYASKHPLKQKESQRRRRRRYLLIIYNYQYRVGYILCIVSSSLSGIKCITLVVCATKYVVCRKISLKSDWSLGFDSVNYKYCPLSLSLFHSSSLCVFFLY